MSHAQVGTTAADASYFHLLPSSITLHTDDAPIVLPLTYELVRRLRHPEYPKTTFKWAATIGRVSKDRQGNALFSPGHKPGSGQVLVEDELSGGKAYVNVTVLPRENLDKRLDQAIDLHPISHDLLVMFPELCKELRLVCGIEYAKTPSPNRRDYLEGIPRRQRRDAIAKHENRFIDINVKHVIPRALLDAMVAQAPDYRWVRYGDVLDLVPKPGKESGEHGVDVLDTKIRGTLSLMNVSPAEAMRKVFESAGIRAQQPALGIGPAGTQTAVISVTLKDTTVRECLNEIVKADGRTIWQFEPRDDGTFLYSVSNWTP